MRPHLKQIEAFDDTKRFKYLLTGRRGGKTLLMKEDICKHVPSMPPKSRIYYIGPTNADAQDLIWDDLEERFDELGWEYRSRTSKKRFEFSKKRYVYVIGADKLRIRGKRAYRVYLDEIGEYKVDLNNVWRAVRPALTDLEGGGIVATTPNGKGSQAYDFYLEALKRHNWKFFTWHTADNPFINESEIEEAKLELDEKSFNQEYMASWESFEGLAYYNFEEALHLKDCSEFNFGLGHINIMLDFNVNPTTLIVGQKKTLIRTGRRLQEMHYFRKEYSLKNSSTIDTMKAFCKDFKKQRGDVLINVYGDAAGQARSSTTGYSDYYYVKEVLEKTGFTYKMNVPGANPAVIDRVAHSNSYLKNYYGETRVNIDPSCNDLIRDLASQPLEGRQLSDKNNLGHKGDAFGYYCWWDHITKQRKPQGTVLL